MKKNVFKLLGIICVLAIAAAFIVACGDGTEGTPPETKFTVTYDIDGTKTTEKVGAQKVASNVPTDTKTATEGLYKGTFSFDGGTVAIKIGKWLDESDAEFNIATTPITKDITLKAVWAAVPADIPATATGANILEKALNYFQTTATSAGDKYTLALGDSYKDEPGVTVAGKYVLDKSNLDLTITGVAPSARIIKPSANDGAFITLGKAGIDADATPVTAKDTTISLTLAGIRLIGVAGVTGTGGDQVLDASSTAASTDSMIRVQHGATLIMKNSASIKGHRNKATDGSGKHGNGSAVCVYGGNLTMEEASAITQNESSANYKNDSGTETGNRNRVGGVYTFVPNYTGATVTLNIQGGQIKGNKCTPGNTADLYATEGGTFNLSGSVVIDEITLNADAPGVNETTDAETGDASYKNAVYTKITVSDLKNPVGKLSLRTTGSIAAAKKVWAVGKEVLVGSALSATDVAKFTLGDFKGNAGFEDITTLKIGTDGKLATP